MRKSQTTTINIFFLLLLFYTEKFMFCQKTYLEKLSLYCYIYNTVFPRQLIGNAVIKYWPFKIGLVDTVRRPKILGNRLGVLAQVLRDTFNLEKKTIC